MRRVAWTLALCVTTATAFALGLGISHHFASRHVAARPASADDRLLAEVRYELDHRYYRRLGLRVLGIQSVPVMLAALHDPYTEYLDPAAYGLLRRQTASSYPGIGLTVLPARGGLLVADAQPGPARTAGLRTGDIIVAVDRASLGPLPFEAAVARILGAEGTSVQLHVLRGTRGLDFRVMRRRIALPAVTSGVVTVGGRQVGYIRLTSFRMGAAADVRRAVRKVTAKGADAIVLDLRANPGGLLDQAVRVSSIFVPRGVVASVVGAHQPRQVYTVSGTAISKLPVAVLVDAYSASAAEVVAAALRDNHRALVVGTRTFGKALVQSIEPLSNGAALKLTTARYLTPAGADISERGVRPDVWARDNPATRADEALAAAVRVLPRK